MTAMSYSLMNEEIFWQERMKSINWMNGFYSVSVSLAERNFDLQFLLHSFLKLRFILFLHLYELHIDLAVFLQACIQTFDAFLSQELCHLFLKIFFCASFSFKPSTAKSFFADFKFFITNDLDGSKPSIFKFLLLSGSYKWL